MKKITFIIVLVISSFSQPVSAQVRVNINLSTQPIWGPEGYDYVNYYYLPDIDVFYNVPNHQYIYLERGRWTFARNLPSRYRDFDLFNSHKVVLNEYKPYRRVSEYRIKYASQRGNSNQKSIRNSQDSRYFENKDHPEHAKWQMDHKMPNKSTGNKASKMQRMPNKNNGNKSSKKNYH